MVIIIVRNLPDCLADPLSPRQEQESLFQTQGLTRECSLSQVCLVVYKFCIMDKNMFNKITRTKESELLYMKIVLIYFCSILVSIPFSMIHNSLREGSQIKKRESLDHTPLPNLV